MHGERLVVKVWRPMDDKVAKELARILLTERVSASLRKNAANPLWLKLTAHGKVELLK